MANGLNLFLVSAEQNRLFDVSGLYNEECVGSTTVMGVIESFSPYLYPFSVEFNILIGKYSKKTIINYLLSQSTFYFISTVVS